MVRVAADHRVVFQFAKFAGKGHMLGAGDVLVAEEDHAVLEQRLANLGHQAFIFSGSTQVYVGEFCAYGAGQRVDLQSARQRAGTDNGRCGANVCFHCEVSL